MHKRYVITLTASNRVGILAAVATALGVSKRTADRRDLPPPLSATTCRSNRTQEAWPYSFGRRCAGPD